MTVDKRDGNSLLPSTDDPPLPLAGPTSPKFERRLAIVACLLPAAYFLLSSLFALIYFKTYASELPQFLRYVLAPGLIGVAFLACAYALPRRLSLSIGTSGIAVIAALFAFETWQTIKLYASLLGMIGYAGGAQIPSVDANNGLPPGYTVKALNRVLKPATLPEAVLSGVPHSQVFMCSRDGKPVTYTADRYGFNNPDSVYDKPISTVVLGDSFIEGYCLEPGKDTVSVLRGTLPDSVGIATRGNGPLMELAALGRFGKELRPRFVVMAFFEGNDWENLQVELEFPWLRQALSENTEFGQTTIPPATLAEMDGVINGWRATEVKPLDVLRRTWLVRNFFALRQVSSELGIAYPKVFRAQPEYVDILRKAAKITESWGGELLVLYIPQAARYDGMISHEFVYDPLRNRVRKAAAEAGVEVIDLAEIFKKRKDVQSLYASDWHFSEEGARVAAQAIIDRLRQPMAAYHSAK
ncbi:SGNH/GDSL hydrolase family protein [Nordella sp. HKS 07]|uniref:alginate O-acetyltransferase AlgX-related protein n=1 Tax=Nordella sp. HKS 07 TaxID=2712222 RepID=UPI0013E1A768|nr:SGNH/GDSL hydrolase family protein [Nordella sp. HKS 07]QIG50851.1 SGNH/GDSL hydrolase family protein [Nordella sp. HKS 07]